MKVIWYNTNVNYYQSGSWEDYKRLQASTTNPEHLLVLERFNQTSRQTLAKIVTELNKCGKRSNVSLR